MKRALGLLALLAALVVADSASAFCGFYVSGADKALTNNATMVVLMRDGTRTVLSMQNAYQGPPEDFAMVVPVPQVLQKENVKTLPRDVFQRVEQLAAPRLVEYWEQDPCAKPEEEQRVDTAKAGMGFGTGRGAGGAGHDLGVTVEAQFAVGEYEIVILSAENAAGLEAWLRQENYKIPKGAEAALRPYVEEGTKFFVAKVDPKKITFDNDGRAMLSPLRVHYDDPKFSLPVRLGLINSGGVQDLIVHILSRETRYEVANYPNVTIPTNLDVDASAKEKFGSVYAKLFDATLERSPGAVVTEYAWSSANCDPCPGPVLSANDLATLGADVVMMKTRTVPHMTARPETVQGQYEANVIRRMLRNQVTGRLRVCYAGATEKNPALAGDVTVKFTIPTDGKVKDSSVKAPGFDAQVTSCMSSSLGGLLFPPPSHGPVTVEQTIRFEMQERPQPPPPMILTRLHARYGKDGLGQDLVFRAALPIVGGREFLGENGKLEEGSRPASSNNFQGRYAIRHPWTGPIACEHPVRGTWGGPPAGTDHPETKAALDLAQAPRAGIELAAFFKADPWTGAVAPALPTVPKPSVAIAPPSKAGGGCTGCTVTDGPTNPAGPLAAAGLATLLLRARARARARARREQ